MRGQWAARRVRSPAARQRWPTDTPARLPAPRTRCRRHCAPWRALSPARLRARGARGRTDSGNSSSVLTMRVASSFVSWPTRALLPDTFPSSDHMRSGVANSLPSSSRRAASADRALGNGTTWRRRSHPPRRGSTPAVLVQELDAVRVISPGELAADSSGEGTRLERCSPGGGLQDFLELVLKGASTPPGPRLQAGRPPQPSAHVPAPAPLHVLHAGTNDSIVCTQED